MSWAEYRALDRRIWVLAWARAVNTAGLAMVMAFMAVYLTRDRGLDAWLVGMFYAGANIAQSAAQAAAGAWSDRTRRVRLIVGALLIRVGLITALGVLVLTDAPVAAICTLMTLSWMARGVFEPVAYAVVADVATPEVRLAAYGLQKLGVNLGWAVGPAVGGLLAAAVGFGAVFFVAAPVLALAAVAVARIDEPAIGAHAEPRSPQGGAHGALASPAIVAFLACAFLSGLMHSQLFAVFSVYVTREVGLGDAALGALWTINAILVVALQLPAVRVADGVGPARSLVLAPLLYAASFILFSEADGFTLMAIGIFVLSLGEVLFEPAQQTMAAELGDPRRMGRAMGLVGGMRMFGSAFALLVGGAALDFLGDRAWLALALIPVAVSAGQIALLQLLERRA
jgi:MFS family permease